MNKAPAYCIVILAGGQSRRMGADKAITHLAGQRLIDILIERFKPEVPSLYISGPSSYGTGLETIADNPDYPGGPLGGIFSISSAIRSRHPEFTGFATIPVDAPFASLDLVRRLSRTGECCVAQDSEQRLHPTFAHWRFDIVDSIRTTHDFGELAPSLQWLARQCAAATVTWSDDRSFLNINNPQDLETAQRKAGASSKRRP